MKTGLLSAVALSILSHTLAHPHGAGHRHVHWHHKRDMVTKVEHRTITAVDRVVYVNQHGEVLYTSSAVKPTASMEILTETVPLSQPTAPVSRDEPTPPPETPAQAETPYSAPPSSLETPLPPPVEAPAQAEPPYSAPPSPTETPSTPAIETPVQAPSSLETPTPSPVESPVQAETPYSAAPSSLETPALSPVETPAQAETQYSDAPPSSTTPAPSPPAETPSAALPVVEGPLASFPAVSLPVPVSIPLPLPTSNDFPPGIAYSPYVPNNCKTEEVVKREFEMMKEYSLVRLYGTDCNQVKFGVAAAHATGKKLILGIYDIKQIDAAVQIIKEEAGDFSRVTLITVGNEEIHKGTAPAAIVAAVQEAKTKLAGIGWKGPVTSVDTFGDVMANKELCGDSDIVTINAQPFFTNTVTADQAGPYVRDRVQDVKNFCGQDKRVIVTEAGWPSSGNANGQAVPSVENQQKAIASLKESFKDGGIIYFTAFDDKWKTDFAGSYNAETHWGIL